jgi:hypothetical protein
MAGPVLEFIQKMSQDSRANIEERSRVRDLPVGTKLRFLLSTPDATATVRCEGLVQSAGRNNTSSIEVPWTIGAAGPNAIALTLQNDWKSWHVTFKVVTEEGEPLIHLDVGGDDKYWRDRQHHWFFEFQALSTQN